MIPLTLDAFAQGLLLPEKLPLHLAEATDAVFAARFAIHRNNVRSARTEALRQGFPVLERLLGAEYFTALAGVFIQQHPPHSAVFHEYGAELADFIKVFPPLVHLGYLADIARLEWARLSAFHAADTLPLEVDTSVLANFADFMDIPLCWSPSVSVLNSAHPLYRLWVSQVDQAQVPSAQDWLPENVLVWRQGLQLRTEPLDELGCRLLRHMQDGRSLASALAQPCVPPQEGLLRLLGLLLWQVFQRAE